MNLSSFIYFVNVILLTVSTCSTGVYGKRFRCPGIGEEPVEVTVPPNNKKLSLQWNTGSSLCTLVSVRELNPNGKTFSNNSPGSDYSVIVALRSYDDNGWEIVPGLFVDKVRIRGCNRRKRFCNIKFTETFEKYYLISSEHTVSFDEELSRFFMQTTFGPTKLMIDDWDYTQTIGGMAEWVKDQASLPPTKHREYFRKRADTITDNNNIGDTAASIQHPCEQYSRWRKYAFTSSDNFKDFEVVNSVDEKFMIIVDGKPRTIVDSFSDESGEMSGVGSYAFCWIVVDSTGGRVEFRSRKSLEAPCKPKQGGNPAIVLLPEEVDNYGMKVIDLPDQSNFEVIPPIVATNWGYNNWLVMEMYRMNVDGGLFGATPEQCEDLEDYNLIVGRFPNGDAVLYSGIVKLMQNTIQDPIADGGLEAIARGAPLCSNTAKTFLNIESCSLAKDDACESNAYSDNYFDRDPRIVKNAVICGSDGEVGSDAGLDPSEPRFRINGHFHRLTLRKLPLQIQAVSHSVFLNAKDQLRQRMAWALSQIFSISPNQIDVDFNEAESYFNYFDIFAKNAFGNFRDVLKEVSYSPMMAEMLSSLESKSASFVLQTKGLVSRPDENFAREVMQLFTIGLDKLNQDGTITVNRKGSSASTYDNLDILTFARAWTGFRRQYMRFNKGGKALNINRIDPLAVEGTWRDPFPKLDLNGDFIGDRYPLCTDLPGKHFLRIGATYRLIGSAKRAELQYERTDWDYDTVVERFPLDPDSALYGKLCNANQAGSCEFRPLVHLDENLSCYGRECEVDNLSVIIVKDDIKYEYVRPACVEHAFHSDTDLKKVTSRHQKAMCLHKDIDDVAMPACCASSVPGDYYNQVADYFCDFSQERTSYSTAQSRCQKKIFSEKYPNPDTCDHMFMSLSVLGKWNDREQCFLFMSRDDSSWHWTNQACSIMAKVNNDGMVSIVHDPNLDINAQYTAQNQAPQSVHQPVSPDNTNYFKVDWIKPGKYPQVTNQCANDACQTIQNACLCNVKVLNVRVYKKASQATKKRIISTLKIGSAPPESYGEGFYTRVESVYPDVLIYKRDGITKFNTETLFGVTYQGKMTYFKNMKSIVQVTGDTGGVKYRFLNPTQFLNIGKPDTRDAMYETEAVLDHFFYHSNTAPFLATRLIKLFGISNPSPRYVRTVSGAFNTGSYTKEGVNFGDGNYGNLEAMVAAITLDREARSVSLDADPSAGSLREPLIKVLSFMRAMEYQNSVDVTTVTLSKLQDIIGQEVHKAPSVFSFFLPEFSPSGKIADAALTSPESQLLDSSKVVGLLNGLFSLVDIGMSDCFGGIGDKNTIQCDGYLTTSPEEMDSTGFLTFNPTNPSTSSGEEVVDEIALLLTGGRLNSNTKTVLCEAYDQENESKGQKAALQLVQKLVVATPEFHSTNVFESIGILRPEKPLPQPSDEPYKAIIFLNLDGGLDSFNVLVPHSDCDGDTSDNTMFDEYTNVRGNIALAKGSLHTIDASNSEQVCDTFGLHQSLPFIRSLYEDNDLAFLANVGVLQQPLTKDNWRQNMDMTQLFAHNTQQDEINFLDIFYAEAGRGACGRMLDILSEKGYNPGAISTKGIASILRSDLLTTVVVDPKSGYQKFNPTSQLTSDVSDKVKEVNAASSIHSSFFGETWSNILLRSMSENELLFEKFDATEVDTLFPETDLGMQLEMVAKVMKTKDLRGTDRDVFNVRIDGFDSHSDVDVSLTERLTTLNDGLEAFVTEMKDYQDLWDDVTIVVVSEFGRTLKGNTGSGSDHAWGGNYFLASGSLDGGKILGKFPSDMTDDGDFVFNGVVVPTKPWEAVWNGVAQWFGIESEEDLKTILPNREAFPSDLFEKSDLFTI